MGVFDKFADAPNQIKKEGQEITIRFQRTGPTTGRISWNIPAPAAGCKTENQAYNGIVITINSKPSNYLSNSPKNGTFYNGDLTGDADLHAGDKLDGALVVAAFYDDKTTTFIDVNDILPRTAYYVSGYAVDAQARYHREGVHAYSLPTGSDEWGLPDKAAQHDIIIDVVGGVLGSTPTGLVIDTDYNLKVLVNGKEYIVTVSGENATTYTDLVAELKEQLALLGDVFVSPLAPHTNNLYYNAIKRELKQWDGSTYVPLPVLAHPEDPTMQELDALWVTPSTGLLKRFDGSVWGVTPYISTPTSPAELECDQSWFDGTNVWLYKLTHWDKLYTYIQSRNPLLAPLLTCDDYWYNKTDGSVSVYNVDAKKWDGVNVIYSTLDPSQLADGTYWYDETAKVVKQLSGDWATLDVTYLDTLPATDSTLPGVIPEYDEAANGRGFIFDRSTLKLLGTGEGVWFEVTDVIHYHVDPRSREKAPLWWDAGADALNVWDAINDHWVTVTNFFQSETNPALPQPVEPNSAWYNPDTKEVKLIFKTACKTIYPIIFNGNPGALPTGTVWFDSVTKLWYVWDGNVFVESHAMYYETDPYFVVSGYYWYDETNAALKRFTGTAWQVVEFETKAYSNIVGSFWFNSVIDELFMWDGKTWTESTGLVSVEMIPPEKSTGKSVLSFFTRDIGCASSVEVVFDADLLLSKLANPVIFTEPVSGESGRIGGAIYNQLGVGDDGSPDERRALHDDIRTLLGHPVVQVELTKEQLDLCINNALKELRKYSSWSYKRGVFFLDLRPNQQTYLLTNKCIGFNKVTQVNSIHRYRGMSMSSTSIDNDAFTYAALQRLYTMGTFDMLSFHLVSAYMEEMETLMANRIMFNWNEFDRELGIFARVTRKERVLVDAFFERTEQDLMLDRQTSLWLQRWATAEAKMMLGQSRGKFQTLPGPNGSTTLNGSDLIQQAQDEMEKLREQLEDHSMQNLTGIGLRAHFILG